MELHNQVQVLSAYRQRKLYEVVASYVNRKWTLSAMITGMATVLQKLDPESRQKVEIAIGNLMPKGARAEYVVALSLRVNWNAS